MGWMKVSVDRNEYANFAGFGGTSGAAYEGGAFSDTVKTNLWNGSTETQGAAFSVGAWNHVAITCAGTGANQLKLWLNGAQDISMSGNSSVSAGRMSFYGDPALGGAKWLNGCIANMSVWTAVLSQSDIIANRFSFAPVGPVHLLNAWYPCRNGPFHFGRDQTFLLNHLTIAGSFLDEPGPPIMGYR